MLVASSRQGWMLNLEHSNLFDQFAQASKLQRTQNGQRNIDNWILFDICQSFLSMQEFKVLEDSAEHSELAHSRNLKLKYLTEEKANMEVLIFQLRANNELLRHINSQIIQGAVQQIDTLLLQRNTSLEDQIYGLMNNVETLSAEVFILQQIVTENEKQTQQIMANYEQRILELRKSVQFKQTILQKLQSQSHLHDEFEQTKVPPYNVSIHFFAEFEEYKHTIEDLLKKNKEITKNNKRLEKQNTECKQKIQRYQSLCLSKCSFLQYRSLLNASKCHSLPHKATLEPHRLQKFDTEDDNQNLTSKLSMNEGMTVSTYFEPQIKQTTLRRIVKKKQTENIALKTELMKLSVKNQQMAKKVKQLIESNLHYQQSRQAINNKLLSCEAKFKDLFEYLTARRSYVRMKVLNELSLYPIKAMKQQVPKKVQQVSKQHWRQMGKELANKKPVPKNKNCLKRSFSCVNDYLMKQVEKVENEKQNSIALQQEQRVSQVKKKDDYQADFSKFIDLDEQSFGNDFSIIVANKKISYAELKKNRNQQNQSQKIWETIINE